MRKTLLLIIVGVFAFGLLYNFDRWGQRDFISFTLSSVAPSRDVKEKLRSVKSAHEFPDNFLIGTSSSAYQVEGGWNEGGKSPSIWDNFVHNVADAVDDNTTADVGPDSFHNYQEDIRALKLVGVKYFYDRNRSQLMTHN